MQIKNSLLRLEVALRKWLKALHFDKDSFYLFAPCVSFASICFLEAVSIPDLDILKSKDVNGQCESSFEKLAIQDSRST